MTAASCTGADASSPPTGPHPAWPGGCGDGVRYGALGLPLAFVALPLYVVLPNHYASGFGVPLAALGALLLGVRLFDALIDPWIGRWADRWFAHSRGRVLRAAALAAGALMAGFHGLFFPAVRDVPALLAWCAALLALTYAGFSVVSVLHQAWGARLGGDASQRARVVSWREGFALAGVLVASVLPSVAGLGVTSAVFAATLTAGVALLWRAPLPARHPDAGDGSACLSVIAPGAAPTAPCAASLDRSPPAAAHLLEPLRTPAFRRLLAIYLVNGIASAVPATLVLFFIRDRLQAQAFEPLFLASYFAAGALSMPLWVRLVARLGLARAWGLGMALAIAGFVWAAALDAGDIAAYAAVCIASGIALGADLTLPGALLAGVIARAGHGGRLEGSYFGWWNFATKLNLALAAGLALPALSLFGYAPGSREPQALQALTLAYCLLPCVLKLAAAGLLHLLWTRHSEDDPK